MTDPELCDHETTEPVDVRDHTTGGTRTVARICTVCLAQLEAGWGCTVCVWEEHEIPRVLCDPDNRIRVEHVLTRPCKEHA